MMKFFLLLTFLLLVNGCAYWNVCESIDKGEMRFDYPQKKGDHYIKVRPYGDEHG